jgi:CDP-diacylglycerol--glycerol-3-phosphate 3-phosphatidyltransferase
LFLIFIIPIPQWIINISLLSLIRPQLTAINYFIINYGNYVSAAIFIIAAATDKVDGYLARKWDMVTKFGIFLDPIADKLMVTAALIALVQRNQVSGWAAMIIIAREFLVTGLRLMANGEKVVLAAGILGKIKMVVQSVAVSLALLKNFPLSLISGIPFDKYAMTAAVIITVYSGFDYILSNKKLILSTEM